MGILFIVLVFGLGFVGATTSGGRPSGAIGGAAVGFILWLLVGLWVLVGRAVDCSEGTPGGRVTAECRF